MYRDPPFSVIYFSVLKQRYSGQCDVMANLKEEAVWTCLVAMYFGGSVNGTVGKHFALTFFIWAHALLLR